MKTYTIEQLKEHKWLSYLVVTENEYVNRERVESIADINGQETLQYVLRTLNILEQYEETLSPYQYMLIERTLQWSEVAKGGTYYQRQQWINCGYPLAIHNLASAEIYNDETDDDTDIKDIVYVLIQTHGIVGQSIRGESAILDNAPLTALRQYFMQDELETILYVLNHCIIEAVNTQLWTSTLQQKVKEICHEIATDTLVNMSAVERLCALCSPFTYLSEDEIQPYAEFFANEVFSRYELWYFASALSTFSPEEICKILQQIITTNIPNDVTYISFKPLQDTLYYDYEQKKKINVYKKRIIEKSLKNNSNDNVSLQIKVEHNAVLVDYVFSNVCQKLIDFCVEAERSGILTFEKSINVLYDMFDFRRDEFDRLNNEDKYLSTMNNSDQSTKNSIVQYVIGQCVVDVGSGGGVLLDLLEKTYPEKTIIGTDISENVIQVLNEKKHTENHRWIVKRHNFVDDPLIDPQPDSIIFSSILHEIYSYTETETGRFNIESVKKSLKNAYDSLRSGGRLIIRDGVKSPNDEEHQTLSFTFKDLEGMVFFKNYYNDFKGCKNVERNAIVMDGNFVSGDYNFMREFLYTYTWGQESYGHEVNEQFGYFTLEECKQYLSSLGARILIAKEFVEQGYIDHLTPLVTLEPKDFPNSNYIIVVEKM